MNKYKFEKKETFWGKLPPGNVNIYRYYSSNLYDPKARRITSENFIKIGS